MDLDGVFKTAVKVFERKGRHAPMVIAESSDGKVSMLMVPSMDPELKYTVLTTIGAVLKEEGFRPGTVFFASEFWFATIPVEGSEEGRSLLAGKKKVSDCDDKTEALCVIASSGRGDFRSMSADIKRGECGKPFVMLDKKDEISMMKSAIIDYIWDGYGLPPEATKN